MKLRHFYFVKNIFCFCHTALICRSWYGVVCAIFFFLVIEKGQLQAQTTITKSIEASSDDAEETGPDGIYNGVGYVALTSIRIELVRDDQSPTSGAQIVGLRFNSLYTKRSYYNQCIYYFLKQSLRFLPILIQVLQI
ncbi:MAG: hypothetical protein IPO98_13605 [Saprospiraceae bacterium]|nr:hypothetical protein [Saprospiraceae bacterium]